MVKIIWSFLTPSTLVKLGLKEHIDYQITAASEETVTTLICTLLYCQVNKINKTLIQSEQKLKVH